MTRTGKYFISLCLIFTILTVCTGKTKNMKKTIKDISPKEAVKLIEDMQDNPNFVIIDIRTPEEFNSGYIKGAILIDYYDNFEDEISGLDKSKIYLIYCRSGNRSGKGLRIMEKAGFTTVYNIKGGINLWRKNNYPLSMP